MLEKKVIGIRHLKILQRGQLSEKTKNVPTTTPAARGYLAKLNKHKAGILGHGLCQDAQTSGREDSTPRDESLSNCRVL